MLSWGGLLVLRLLAVASSGTGEQPSAQPSPSAVQVALSAAIHAGASRYTVPAASAPYRFGKQPLLIEGATNITIDLGDNAFLFSVGAGASTWCMACGAWQEWVCRGIRSRVTITPNRQSANHRRSLLQPTTTLDAAATPALR